MPAMIVAVALAVLAAPAVPAAGLDDLLPRMVAIPAGDFVMGSPDGEPQSKLDEPRHQVQISRPFELAATEVTQALWQAVMDTNPAYFTDCPDGPVDHVSWFDALSFCNLLSRRRGLTPVYALVDDRIAWNPAADGYRLPTESEWEYACRAGTTSAFHTGACLDPLLANYDGYRPLAGCSAGMKRGEPVAVGSLTANAWGLHDMHGNLAEWCWDWYGPYPRTAVRDPGGPETGTMRVVRGGCWDNPGQRCRAANREVMPPNRRLDMIGLRLARTVTR